MFENPLILFKNEQNKFVRKYFVHDPQAEIEFNLAKNSALYSSHTGHNFSVKPLLSTDYGERVCCVLLGKNQAGLTYNNNFRGTAPRDTRQLYSTMRVYGEENLAAVLIAGNTDYLRSIEDFLRAEEVPVLSKFVDGWELPEALRLKKSVLVIPERGEVILKVESLGYLSLTP